MLAGNARQTLSQLSRHSHQPSTRTMVSVNPFRSMVIIDHFLKGGGARYPYPKEVWSPAGALDKLRRFVLSTYSYITFIIGGWWTRPSNWKANTAILFAGILGVSYGVWTVSADKEVSTPFLSPQLSVTETLDFQYRYNEPTRRIPSMLVSPCSSVFYTASPRPLFFPVGKAVPGIQRKEGGR